MGRQHLQGQRGISVLAVSLPISSNSELNAIADFLYSIVAIILAFITFLLLGTFPGWHEERDARTGSEVDIKPFPSRPVCQVSLALIFISSIFVLVSVLWQHTSAVAAAQVAEDFGNGSVKSGIGTTAMTLAYSAS